MSRDPAATAPLGSRLLGDPDENPRQRRIRVRLLLTFSVIFSNCIGAALASVLVAFVLPGPNVFAGPLLLVDFLALPLYVFSAVVVGGIVGGRLSVPAMGWTTEDRAPTPKEVTTLFRVPWRLTWVQGVLWVVAGVLFTIMYGLYSPDLIWTVLVAVAFSAVLVCTVSYLLIEFSLRPFTALAITARGAKVPWNLGIGGRGLLYWGLASALPIGVLMTVAVYALSSNSVSKDRLAVCVLSFGAILLVAGLYVTYLTMRATTMPIRGLRAAMKRIGEGKFDTSVVVYDGTEIGELQSGFNVMAQGLQEREAIREIFGQHVGKEVARAALAQSPELGGEDREVAVLFVDIIGSTTIAATRSPGEVVGLLNRFFKVIVDEVDERGGFINKFEGDGALAVFGAPSHLPDPAGSALQAARAIIRRLRKEVPECQAGLGVSFGVAVAGNIGSDQRFEYTVIGDPVNEAARLCELAKTTPGKVLASEAAVSAAKEEAEQWRLGDEIILRGRTSPTRLAQPAGA